MKYYIVENKYATNRSIVISSEYKVINVQDLDYDCKEINNHLVMDIDNEDFKQNIYIGTIYFKTNDLIQLAVKIAELLEERRKVTCYEQK